MTNYHGTCKLGALELHNSWSYIIIIKLHKLDVCIVSHMVSCIHYNSYDLFDNTHTRRNTLSCNELQMVIATQKLNCKANYQSPHFLIVPIYKNNILFPNCQGHLGGNI
jgi:hypothetical protein